MNVLPLSQSCVNRQNTSKELGIRGFSKVTLSNCASLLRRVVTAIKRVAMNWTAFFVTPSKPIAAILTNQIEGELLGCSKAAAHWSPWFQKRVEKALAAFRAGQQTDQGAQLKDWKVQEVELEMDGPPVNVQLLTHPQHLTNRWMLYSGGNAECMEMHLPQSRFPLKFSAVLKNAQSLRCQVALFNYPGVGKSGGQLNRTSMVKSYRAVLSYLENKLNGCEGAQIIGYGWSMGGAVQAEAFENHEPNSTIQYALIKDRTFSQLAPVADDLIGPLSAWLLQLLGWNFCSDAKVLKSKLPEYILQTCEDEIISTGNSLASAVESQSDGTSWRGHILWTEDSHFGQLNAEKRSQLIDLIENELSTPQQHRSLQI